MFAPAIGNRGRKGYCTSPARLFSHAAGLYPIARSLVIISSMNDCRRCAAGCWSLVRNSYMVSLSTLLPVRSVIHASRESGGHASNSAAMFRTRWYLPARNSLKNSSPVFFRSSGVVQSLSLAIISRRCFNSSTSQRLQRCNVPLRVPCITQVLQTVHGFLIQLQTPQ